MILLSENHWVWTSADWAQGETGQDRVVFDGGQRDGSHMWGERKDIKIQTGEGSTRIWLTQEGMYTADLKTRGIVLFCYFSWWSLIYYIA